MGDEQAKDRVIEILYRNHRGEIAMRRIEPVAMRFEATEWHPEPQWIIDAWDLDKQARRSFAFKDILPAPLVWSSDRPTVVGDYHVRYASDPENRWFAYYDETTVTEDLSGLALEFAGPVPEPMEKESGE